MNFSAVLKWIGYGTAILSFAGAVGGVVKVVTDRAARRHQTQTLLASEQVQLMNHDYSAAWQTLDQAAKVDGDSPAVQEAQENLAMEWLENIRVQGDDKFSGITQKLDPVLTRGITSAKSPQHQADLTAHLGWSYFLRSREGTGGLDPAASYAQAVKEDANNPYAQAMWGHWILWNHGDSADAAKHFEAGLASNRAHEFVRRLQCRGRDAGFPTPPAQIRTCRIAAYGSYLG